MQEQEKELEQTKKATSRHFVFHPSADEEEEEAGKAESEDDDDVQI